MSAAKAPPRKSTSATRSPRPTAAAPPPPKSNVERRADGLTGLGQLAQGLCLLTGQFADAAAIGQHWQGVAVELANVSEEYESVAKPVDFLIKVGPFGALIAAGMPFVLQILANHKIVPAASLAGQCIMPPEVLEAQMRAQILRMQADAVRAQNDALQEARDAQAAYDAMTMDGVSDAELVGAAG